MITHHLYLGDASTNRFEKDLTSHKALLSHSSFYNIKKNIPINNDINIEIFSKYEKEIESKSKDQNENSRKSRRSLSVFNPKKFYRYKNDLTFQIELSKTNIFVNKLLDTVSYSLFMTLITIYSLFGLNIRICFLSASVDFVFSIITFFSLIVFILEVILSSLFKENYLFSYFFYLDILGSLSLLVDIDWLINPLLSAFFSSKISNISSNTAYITKISNATKITKTLKVLRIFKFIQIVKLYKNTIKARNLLEFHKIRSSKAKLSSKLLIENKNLVKIDQLQRNPIKNESHQLIVSPNLKFEELRRGSTPIFNNSLNFTGGNRRISFNRFEFRSIFKLRNKNIENLEENMKHLDQLGKKSRIRTESAFIQKKEDVLKRKSIDQDEYKNQFLKLNESRLSKKFNEKISKKIIVIIISIILTFPFLQSNSFLYVDLQYDYGLLANLIQNLENKSQTNIQKWIYFTSNQTTIINVSIHDSLLYFNPKINIKDLRTEDVDNFSQGPISIFFSLKFNNTIVALLDLILTIFVCISMTLNIYYIEQDTQVRIISPLEVMFEIVDLIAHDPTKANDTEALYSGIKAIIAKQNTKKKKIKLDEIRNIETSILKISALLSIGYGDAGVDIIKESLMNNEFSALTKGRHKISIYGFCHIHNFQDINTCLKERIMIFVNEIAEIVHSSVYKYLGSTNKNLGDCFLNIWRFTNNDYIKEQNEEIALNINSNLISKIADCALLGYLDIIYKINSSSVLSKYKKHIDIINKLKKFRVSLGFGLNIGWAIEGAIGSINKIDTSYLSPNVNITSRLESATSQYGVQILISGDLYNFFSEDSKDACRLIDIVTLKGSQKPIRLYTIDLNLDLKEKVKSKIQMNYEEKRLYFKNKKEKMKILLDEEGFCIGSLLYTKVKFMKLLDKRKEDLFYQIYDEALENYIEGIWDIARAKFIECLAIDPNDGPTKTLLKFMERYNYRTPHDWKGYRELILK